MIKRKAAGRAESEPEVMLIYIGSVDLFLINPDTALTFEGKPQESETTSQMEIRGNIVQGREERKCKDP